MIDQYTAQRMSAGLGRNGTERAGILVCRVDKARHQTLAYPEQWIDGSQCDEWCELWKRYPMAQVIRLHDVNVPFSELRAYRRFEKARVAS